MKIVAVIPAHNEQASVGNTVRSLLNQVDMVYVVSDNSTDSTVSVAADAGASVMETVGNTGKKAGALNQVLDIVLPGLTDEDFVFAVDADTIISDVFVARALRSLRNPKVGAVGGVFYGVKPSGILQLLQANEYVRYSRQINRTGRTKVLSGTAALIRVAALKGLKTRRGFYYDESALTEDMEIGLALKTDGWLLKSPVECSCTTELMPTLPDLNKQRVRWYRGAMENLKTYGVTKVTASYWGQQGMLMLSVLMMSAYLLFTTVMLVMGHLTFSPFWTMIGVVLWLERVVTAWGAGWRGRVLSALMLPEFVYDIVLQKAYVSALVKTTFNQKAEWHHVS